GQEKTMSDTALEWLARLAPVVFLAGLIMAVSSGIHAWMLYLANDLPRDYVADYWAAFETLNGHDWRVVLAFFTTFGVAAGLYSLRLDINIFSLNNFYRNRLVRCYLGATRDIAERQWQPFTGFDPGDDIPLQQLLAAGADDRRTLPFAGPFPIINCALN